MQVSLTHRQTASQAGDTLAIHGSVGNLAQSTAHEISTRIPRRRAGGGIGATPLTGPEPGLLGGRCGLVEVHIDPLGQNGRGATGPTIDTGGTYRRHEPAVEAAVTPQHGPVTTLVVEGH